MSDYRIMNNVRAQEKNQVLTRQNNVQTLIGIDIGTTNLSVAIVSIVESRLLASYTIPNDSVIFSANSNFRLQDAEWITRKIHKVMDYLLRLYPCVSAIGITGQMHGMVYLDDCGKAISPLYTWQDNRGNEQHEDRLSYCDKIHELTGYRLSSGYGFVTHYYNSLHSLVPADAVTFCTITDYVGMRLTGRRKPLLHPSNAESLGLYNHVSHTFDAEAIRKLGLVQLQWPEIARDDCALGYFGKILVAVSIGDNQASVFGTVQDEGHSALLNIGTGSQISRVVNGFVEVSGLECRNYIGGSYLLNGSALCGGRAYSVLEKFFRAYVCEISGDSGSQAQYQVMNKLAERAYFNRDIPTVSTKFCGTRENAKLRGSISNISDINFLPENLVLGTLQGIVEELADFYDTMPHSQVEKIVISGNAVRENRTLQRLIADRFDAEVLISGIKEEAALGCALYAAVVSGTLDLPTVKSFIRYLPVREGNCEK